MDLGKIIVTNVDCVQQMTAHRELSQRMGRWENELGKKEKFRFASVVNLLLPNVERLDPQRKINIPADHFDFLSQIVGQYFGSSLQFSRIDFSILIGVQRHGQQQLFDQDLNFLPDFSLLDSDLRVADIAGVGKSQSGKEKDEKRRAEQAEDPRPASEWQESPECGRHLRCRIRKPGG